jgi:hypothetical protein
MDDGVTAANEVSESAAEGTEGRAARKRRRLPDRSTLPARLTSPAVRRSLRGILVLIASLCVMAAADQPDTEAELKAGFLYNFMKFVEWPADALPTGRPLHACVIGSPNVADALARGVTGRLANGRSVTVSTLAPEDALRSCHLLYVEGLDEGEARRIVAKAAGLPAFTVSDFERFAARGGVANFFVAKDRLRFAINPDAARRARLQISSRMLAIATIVTEDQ